MTKIKNKLINVNNNDYWNIRFEKDWIEKGGKTQTQQHMMSVIPILKKYIPHTFTGQILDFGCALGDGIPILHHHFPYAKLIGVDYSKTAISHCIERYGDFANFICNENSEIPFVDVIVSLHCIEHITDDKIMVRTLLKKCSSLFVTVPYNENIEYIKEHIHSYNKEYFSDFIEHKNIYINSPCRNNIRRFIISFLRNFVFNNIKRFLLGKKLSPLRTKQITYYFSQSN